MTVTFLSYPSAEPQCNFEATAIVDDTGHVGPTRQLPQPLGS
jgi:hypothetical protein